jgi:hypothetical protein
MLSFFNSFERSADILLSRLQIVMSHHIFHVSSHLVMSTLPATLPLKEQEECLLDPHSLPDPPPKYASPLSSCCHGLFAFGIANLKMVDQNQIDFINCMANHEAVVHGWCRAHCYLIAFKDLLNDAPSCENYKEAQVFSDAAQRWQSISNHEKSLMESCRWAIKYSQQKITLHSKRHE